MPASRKTATTAPIRRLRLRFPAGFSFASVVCDSMVKASLAFSRRERCFRVESAAEGADQVDRQGETARPQVRFEALLREELRFGAQHFEQVADAFAIAQHRQ